MEPRNPAPLYGTPRNPSRKTLGPAISKVMTALGSKDGKPADPHPWQRELFDIACEIDPDTGAYWYKTVIVVVLRRAGKTTMSRSKVLHRAITTPNARVLYTAQNRIKALKRLRDDFHVPYMASPFEPLMDRPRWRGGEEALRWLNGAELAIDAVGRKAGHGDEMHEAHIDEAYVHTDSTLQDGVQPALMTVPGSQLWVLSAAGDSSSLYLREKVELGRAIVASGLDSRTCYIEYSAPLDSDPNDPETLWNTHPSMGRNGLNAAEIMDLRVGQSEESLRGWERAWLGWWPRAKQPDAVIPGEAWRSCYPSEDDDLVWDGEPLWCIDVSPERDWASIAMAGRSVDPSARCFIELVQREEGTPDWTVPRLRQLAAAHGGWTVAIDGGGGATALAADLEDAGFEVVRMPAAQRPTACGGIYDDVLARRIRTTPNGSVTEARINAAKLRVSGGEGWVFSRGRSMQDITALYALIVARWAWIENRGSDYDVSQSIY